MFLLIPLMFAETDSQAQHNGEAIVYLTNYVLAKGANDIGYVKLKSGEIKSITVDGNNRIGIKVGKDHKLSVDPDKLGAGQPWFDITLKIKLSSSLVTKTFRIVKDNFVRNKVIAHRGAWKNTGATENSIAALDCAIKLGCEGSEFDVHMSADSLPVVHHDPTIGEISIAKTNSRDLLGIKLANGETLPTLENYLEAGLNQNKMRLILEIKPSELGKESSIALTRKIVALVEKLQGQGWVDYISFDYDVCKEVMTLAPYAKVAYLNGDKSPEELAAANFFGLDYNYKILQKNPQWVTDAKARKLTVNVWTVNDRPAMEELLKQDVDFITTNEPELLLSIVK